MKKFSEINESKDDLTFNVKLNISVEVVANSEEEASFKVINMIEENDKISDVSIISTDRKTPTINNI